jgi:hypothetical protein
MRWSEIIKETASAGATSSGNIAVVVNPAVAHSKKKPKMQKPTDNALDNNDSLFGNGVVKRNPNTALSAL